MNTSFRKAAGNLDPDFGNAGQARIPEGLNRIRPKLLDDQRILSVGGEHANNVVVLTRHLSNGELDDTFGEQGAVRITMPRGPEVGGVRHELLSDSRSLCFGAVGLLVQSTGFVFRVLANGDVDTSFGESGFYFLDEGASSSITNLGVLSDGKIMVTMVILSGTTFTHYLARLDNGHLDTTYGDDGSGMVLIGTGFENVYGFAVLPNDGILLSPMPLALDKAVFHQYLPDGQLDPAFGTDGVVELVLDQGRLGITKMLRQPDGKIVAVGSADVGFGMHFLITRLDADGGMDSTFNNGEPKIMVLQGYEAQAEEVVLQADNKIVAIGSTSNNAPPVLDDFVLMRFLPNGMIDSSFGNNGQVMSDFGARDRSHQAQVQADGKILVSGIHDTLEEPGTYALLVRYLA